MKITRIQNIKDFQAIRANWETVYQADSLAQFFLSWVWLSGWFQILSDPWLVLAARLDDESDYVAFFPLILTDETNPDGQIESKLRMGGNRMADYTGLICLPEYEERVISAFAEYIENQLNWSTFHLENILDTDPRMAVLIEHFGGDRFEKQRYRVSNNDGIDNYICPCIALPETWEWYLQNVLSLKMRRNLRRFMRTVENSDEFQIVQTTAENLEQHIQIAIELWQDRWQDKKGEQCQQIAGFLRRMIRHCFENNCLYFPVLWQGNIPVGTIVCWIDSEKKAMFFYMTGRNPQFNNPAPGIILNAYGIKLAIDRGFKTYDFLRGNESYKFSFGTQQHQIKYIVIKRQAVKNHNSRLDLDPISAVFQQAIQHHQCARFAEAEQGYHQVLEQQPQHLQALHRLGILMHQKEDYLSSEIFFKSAIEVDSNSLPVWFSLGNLYQSQHRFAEAIEAYQKVLDRQPHAVAVYNNLGYTWQLQGKWAEAIACYHKALEIQPNCTEADVNLGNALYARGQLSPEQQSHYAGLNYDLGVMRQKSGDVKTAILYYQQAIVMNPDLIEARKKLEMVLPEPRA